MNANEHKTCYGDLFPDTLHVSNDRPKKGKVFSYTLHTAGGLYRAARETGVDTDEWDRCTQRSAPHSRTATSSAWPSSP